MSANRLGYQPHLFTLQLWRESVGDDQFEWRGAIKNTETGEVRYFRDWHMLTHLLPAMLPAVLGEPDDSNSDPAASQ